jgi:hypothetical protein
MQLVSAPDTDCYFWFRPPVCSVARYSISVSHMSVELVQCMSQLLNLMFIQIFTHVKFAENKRSWQWEDDYFFAECMCVCVCVYICVYILIERYTLSLENIKYTFLVLSCTP